MDRLSIFSTQLHRDDIYTLAIKIVRAIKCTKKITIIMSFTAVIVAKYKQNWHFGSQLLFQILSLGSYFPAKVNPSFPSSWTECNFFLVPSEACILR